MGLIVGIEGTVPQLELGALGRRQQELLGEGDRRRPMGDDRVDGERRCRQPVPFLWRAVAQGSVAQELPERLEQRSVPCGHPDLEDEPKARGAAGEGGELPGDDEASLPGDQSAEEEGLSTFRGGNATESVEAMGLEPTDLLHAMQALYQLSYAPARPANATSRRPLLESLAH